MALVLCLALLPTSFSNAQDVTGNLVNFTSQSSSVTSTWQNAGSIGQPLSCWGGGDPGYCGPLPRVAVWGMGSNIINFSYGLTDLNQIVNIKNALPNSGTGLQVSGFNFSFMAKNGNGWDDGRQDYLMAYVNIYNNTNSKILESYNYDLNRRYNWTQFSFSETFTTPYGVPGLGNAKYGFIGRDNNYWMGPYGPEITDTRFSLKYSVDPCSTNVLSSPSCAGYNDALAKLIPKNVASTPMETTTPIGTQLSVESVTITPTGTFSAAPLPAGLPPPQPESQLQQQAGSPPPPGAPTPGPGQQQAAMQPSPGGAQPKVGEVADSGGSTKPSSGVSLSQALSMISSNQDKTSALEKSVVQAADAQAFSAGETAKQQAEKIAGDTQSQSIANSGSGTASGSVASTTQSSFMQNQGSGLSMQGNTQGLTGSNASRQQLSTNTNVGTQIESFSSTTSSQQTRTNQAGTRQEAVVATYTPSVSYNLYSPNRASSSQIELPPIEGIKFGNKGVLENAMDAKPVIAQTSQGQQEGNVKSNVQNNEAAGNVTIESIAKQPAGYAQYFVVLTDATFYTPKEIYRNQNNVDNVRALRQLGSDRLHREMVNQQYK